MTNESNGDADGGDQKEKERGKTSSDVEFLHTLLPNLISEPPEVVGRQIRLAIDETSIKIIHCVYKREKFRAKKHLEWVFSCADKGRLLSTSFVAELRKKPSTDKDAHSTGKRNALGVRVGVGPVRSPRQQLKHILHPSPKIQTGDVISFVWVVARRRVGPKSRVGYPREPASRPLAQSSAVCPRPPGPGRSARSLPETSGSVLGVAGSPLQEWRGEYRPRDKESRRDGAETALGAGECGALGGQRSAERAGTWAPAGRPGARAAAGCRGPGLRSEHEKRSPAHLYKDFHAAHRGSFPPSEVELFLLLISHFIKDELIKAITARSARQRSSEYSDDFDSDEIVSLGDFSDTSVDENSVKKKMNYFQISDDEEKNSPKLSFLKTKKSNSDITKDKPVFAVKNDEETAPDGCEDMVINALSESQNKDQAIEKEKIKMKLKPRILPVKNTSSDINQNSRTVEKTHNSDVQLSVQSCGLELNIFNINHHPSQPVKSLDRAIVTVLIMRSSNGSTLLAAETQQKFHGLTPSLYRAENSSSLEADDHFKPSPRPRSMLKKHSLREEKDGPGEDKETALHEESEAHSAPSSLPRLNGRQLEAEKKAFSENLGPEVSTAAELLYYDPSLSSSSLKEGLGDSFSPGSEEKASVKDQKEDLTENHNSLKPSENEENSSLIDFVTPALEKCKENQVTTDDLEEEKEKTELIMNDDLAVDPPLLKSQSVLISSNATESAKKTIEDRNMKNKKSTNNRASSASGRLMTSEFLKKSSSTRKTPSATTSSHYLGTLKVLDQKPSQKQNMEPDRADNIRAAVYQEWLEKKNVYLHEMHRIKRIESENLRIQNEQKRAAKREEALASFEAWKAMKEKEAKKIAAKKKLEEKNKKKTEEENAVRKGEALQAFERWKEKKMEYLKEKNKKEKEYERAKKQKEEETVAEKRKDNLTAVEKWNEKKEALFKEKEKEKINEKRKEELKRAEKKDKDKQAIDEYEKWLEKKERQERIERKQKKHHSFLENEALPPWSPPSRTVFSKAF
ncbi:hypothetical protein HPG69_006606 [Diceros bicornis minor]|uniref:Microtubule-associated protein 9 n=1 Tax=Diceros bicornis minor TaxID=77932 RepID=A0A7J7F5W9_DICBM|nr:hypothetical protein HPG69_006606 [Diceros bicornis minor]